MTRTARHDGVRTFGKRALAGARVGAFEADPLRGRSFGARPHFVVRPVIEAAPVPAGHDGSAAVNLAAAVGVAAVLIAASPSDGNAAAAPATSETAVTEMVQEAAVDAVPEASADLAIAGRDLYLEVFINNVSTGLVGNFRETPDGGLSCAVDELSEVGIKPVSSAIGPDGWVRVDQLPGVEYRVDEETQQIYVTTGIEGRATNEISVAPGISEERIEPTSSWGGVVNYSLFASSNSLTRDEGDLFQGVSGDFDARIFSPFGTLNQSFVAGYSDGELDDVVRLNTTWTYSDVNRMMTYRAGDIVSSGLSWTRPVYLGGFQAQRNFSLRSDLVTMPLPSFKGTAAVPSTLEVYAQNAQTYSAPVGEGPFELNNLPIYSGSGEARVVLRDALGRETETTLPFYASNKMLAPGLLDFSLDVGAPRLNFGTDSFDYDERIYGVATARYGLTDWLTLEAHAEGGEDLLNAGAGAIFPLAHFGVGSVAAAGSQHDDEIGMLINATAEIEFNEWTFFGRLQRTFGDYHDIASVTADAETEFPDLAHAEIFSPETPRAIEQVAISVPMPLDLSSLNLSYTHIEDVSGQESQVVGVSYNQQVFKNVALYASAFVDLEKKDTFGVFAGLSMPLGGDYSATAGVDSSGDGTRLVASVAKAERLENGNFSWRAQTSEGQSSQRSASATYRSPWARFEAGVQQADKEFRATGQVDGAIAVAGGGIFATNRIHDAFAVVDVGAADVDVLYQNRSYGKTNGSGKIIVTGLNSYEKNMIAIDPKSLPVDADIPATKEVVVPAGQSGVRVDFGVKTENKAALVNLVGANGQPLDVGLSGRVDGSAQEFVVGYDGQAYVGGLSNNNTLSVDLENGSQCHATFQYTPKKGEQSVIEGVQCL